MNPAKPFCVDSVCTDALPDPTCSVLTNLYQCTSSGIFPGKWYFPYTYQRINKNSIWFLFFFLADPNDCTRYYSCSAPKEPALSFQCDRNKKLVFSAERKLCVPAVKTSSSYSRCQVVNCANHMHQFIQYPGNPSYYAYCTPSATLMLKCLDDENQIFQPKTNKCTFNCKSAGYFPDRTSCTDYFICEREHGLWIATKESCPPNYKFNGSKCVYTPNCTPEITSYSQ